jgi:hypothetical protein
VALQVGCEGFGIALLVGFREAAVHSLQSFHQQLQTAHVQDVAGDLSAVHALLSGLDLQSGQLLVGDVLEDLRQKVHTMFQVIAAQTLAEVI